MRLFPLILLALVAGCRSDRLTASGGDLTVETRVHFPNAIVGYSSQASVAVRNGGRTTRVVRVETQLPFSITTATFELPGGSTLPLEVTFTPTTAGELEGLLTVESEDQHAQSTLIGRAELAPACAERGPCWHSRYDHAAGGCVKVNEPNASACNGGSACLLTSQCISGECVGTAKNCSDNNACTTDACDPNTGCVHFSATARCGASIDACQAPACDPVLGCTFTDAPDGTSCGASDCQTAAICLVGKCRTVPVTDGAACGSTSPCQPRGLCANQVCERPAPTELAAAWTLWAGPGRQLLWDSIADRFHNVYWRERDPDLRTSYIVSVTSAGFKRFEVPIPPNVEQMALIEDLLILRFGAKLEARSVNNGELKWTKELTDPAVPISIRTLARGPAGTLYIGATRAVKPAEGLFDSAVLALNLGTGATKWQVLLPGQRIDDQSTPVDEAGYLYVGTTYRMGMAIKHRYYGFTPQGQQRWAIENPHRNPAAVFGGRVYHWDHWLSETATGSWVNTTPPTLEAAGYPRLALGAVSYVGSTVKPVPSCTVPGSEEMAWTHQLLRVDPGTSQIKWSREIVGPDAGGYGITNTILTSRNTVLFSQPENFCNTTKRTVLREISAEGEESFSCQLPGLESYHGEGLLNDRRWIVAVTDPSGRQGVRAVTLPGFELPAHGWSTAWGSPARDNHAR